MRGNPGLSGPGYQGRGSIPAYAGEPTRAAFATLESGVYPRVCGGTPAGLNLTLPLPGLSPRMRGNRADHL